MSNPSSTRFSPVCVLGVNPISTGWALMSCANICFTSLIKRPFSNLSLAVSGPCVSARRYSSIARVVLQKNLHVVDRHPALPGRDQLVDLGDSRERVLPAFFEILLARIPRAQEVIRMRDEPGALVLDGLRALRRRLHVQDFAQSVTQDRKSTRLNSSH